MTRIVIIYIVSLILLPESVFLAKIIIVAETVGDFNKIQSAINIAVPGDTILVREKSTPYFEKITFPRSGNQINGHIVLMNYPDETPIIDGNGLSYIDDWPQGLIRIVDQNYIKVIGFEIRNILVSNSNVFPAGIWLYGSLSNIEITNNKIHTIQQNANNAGAHGLAVYGTHYTSPISDILINGNEIYNCKLGWSESLVLNGNVENFIVSNNVVHDNNNIAFDFIGHEGECPNPELDQARKGIVFGNIAYNIDSRGNPAYGNEASADGFYVDGGKDIIIERNTVYNCNIGIEIASEHKGKSTSGIIVRNNLVRQNTVLGIAFGGYDNQRGSTNNCQIINNTLYKNSTANFDWGSEILVQYYCENNIVSNNIIYSSSDVPMLDHTTNSGSNNIFSNNLYFTDGTAKWNYGSASYSNFNNYRINSGQEENSLFANPLLRDPENDNPNLDEGSPAIDEGKIYESQISGSMDYFGNDRIVNNLIDIGAVEYNNITSVNAYEINIRNEFNLLPVYPNPFNPTTTITIEIPFQKSTRIYSLVIYDLLGRKLLSREYNSIGNEIISYRWNAEDYMSGIYFVSVSTRTNNQTEKILLMK